MVLVSFMRWVFLDKTKNDHKLASATSNCLPSLIHLAFFPSFWLGAFGLANPDFPLFLLNALLSNVYPYLFRGPRLSSCVPLFLYLSTHLLSLNYLERSLFSILNTSKFKHDLARIELSSYSLTVARINHLYTMKFSKNGTVVAFKLAHFPGLLVWGSFLSLFLTNSFFFPFDFYFRAYPLFIFLFSSFSYKIWNLGSMQGWTYLALPQSIMKNETYWYRNLTVAPLGDNFSWWKVKNNRSDGLIFNSCWNLKFPSAVEKIVPLQNLSDYHEFIHLVTTLFRLLCLNICYHFHSSQVSFLTSSSNLQV